MWWYEINCSEILWVHTIYLHMSCKYALITKTFSSWPETWDTPKYLDICWYISVDRRAREKSKSYLIALRFLLCLFVSVGWNLLDFYTLIPDEPDIDRIVFVLLNSLQLRRRTNKAGSPLVFNHDNYGSISFSFTENKTEESWLLADLLDLIMEMEENFEILIFSYLYSPSSPSEEAVFFNRN